MKNRPSMLMILDGFGLNEEEKGNAVAAAKTPNLDKIFQSYPKTKLQASGHYVGLPDGQMGNSEVGHLNIGAGRIVYQELTNISNKIENGQFFENPALIEAMEHVKSNCSTLHLMGLLSDGGVHSHIDHLLALLDMAKKRGVAQVVVHCFLDGRDVPPKSAMTYMMKLQDHMREISLGQIGVVSGRFYAMDRDKRWDRLELAYDALTLGQGEYAGSGITAIKAGYMLEQTDEFLVPTCVGETTVDDGDSIIFFNFRPDRAREITRAFVDENFDGFERKKIVKDLCYVCMTQYDATMPNVLVAYPPERINNTLGEYVAKQGLHQLRIAETEKYAHVTFFFNGGVEEENPGEDRILVPSPKVATYDLQPEMSAYTVTEKLLEAIKTDKYDLIILNFANADMVGHTGVFEAAVKAIEALDDCVQQIVDLVLEKDGQILLTADHGNADKMLDDNGNLVTSHSLNPVPLVHIANKPQEFKGEGKLADLAPTLLKLMGLEVPAEMTGEALV
ncbi:MAG: 2,3-bisphosphoglycerate-independent phosphoglycerate mutase [Clostridia bacterium]|nr:2,3-bisphosphoglycerate-independent phosphoglycerate mutase [Clostridia bacterium]